MSGGDYEDGSIVISRLSGTKKPQLTRLARLHTALEEVCRPARCHPRGRAEHANVQEVPFDMNMGVVAKVWRN